MELEELRKKIDKIDDEIVELFVSRMETSKKIAETKNCMGKSVYDKEREDIVIKKVKKQSGKFKDYTEKLYREIMELSKEYQNNYLKNSNERQKKYTGEKNIVLIGMPGCGKSTIAEKISELSGLQLLETDKEIEKKEGRTISDIFETEGEKYFRQIEKSVCKIAGKNKNMIISTGGGVIKNFENIQNLKTNGRIYYIIRDIELLDTGGRPLSSGGLQKLKELFDERKCLYEEYSDVKIMNDSTVEHAAIKILEDYNAHSCD